MKPSKQLSARHALAILAQHLVDLDAIQSRLAKRRKGLTSFLSAARFETLLAVGALEERLGMPERGAARPYVSPADSSAYLAARATQLIGPPACSSPQARTALQKLSSRHPARKTTPAQ